VVIGEETIEVVADQDMMVDLAVGQIAEEAHLGINEVAVHSVIQEVARLETKEVDPEIATEMIAVHEAHTVEDTTDEVKEVMKGVTVMTGVTVKVTLISEAVQEEIQIESQLKNSANQIQKRQLLVRSLIFFLVQWRRPLPTQLRAIALSLEELALEKKCSNPDR